MTKKEAISISQTIDMEGFDYAFIHKSSFKDIKDEEFHKLRLDYVESEKKLQAYLEKIFEKYGIESE